MNTTAMQLPASALAREREQRILRKREEQAVLDDKCGKDRVRITSYMDNLDWPENAGGGAGRGGKPWLAT